MNHFLKLFLNTKHSFDGEEKDEVVRIVLRRHPFVILIKFVYFAILLVIPFIIKKTFSQFSLLNESFIFLSAIWYVIVWSHIFYSLTMYTLDVWILTNKRVIDSTQHGFFRRTISELHINRIQDISVKTEGVIQTLLRFGDLHIQTAGTEERFKFLQIPNPTKVKDEIMELTYTQKPPQNL